MSSGSGLSLLYYWHLYSMSVIFCLAEEKKKQDRAVLCSHFSENNHENKHSQTERLPLSPTCLPICSPTDQ